MAIDGLYKAEGDLESSLKGIAEEIWRVGVSKDRVRYEIANLEAHIKRLKGSDAAPKEVWRLENQLAKKTRERNGLADRMGELRTDSGRTKQNLINVKRKIFEEKQAALRKELEMNRPRKIRR